MTQKIPVGKTLLLEPPVVGQSVMLEDERRARITKVEGVTCELAVAGVEWMTLAAVWEVSS